MGTGLFFALLPEALRESLPAHRRRIRPGHRPHRAPGASRGPGALRGLHPQHSRPAASISRSATRPSRTASCAPTRRPPSLGLRLHDYFIARSIARLRPGGIALFVTSTGTMDKASTTAREHIAEHGRPGRRRAPARGQHARDRRHRGRDRRAGVSAPRGGPGAACRAALDGPADTRVAGADSRTGRRRC